MTPLELRVMLLVLAVLFVGWSTRAWIRSQPLEGGTVKRVESKAAGRVRLP